MLLSLSQLSSVSEDKLLLSDSVGDSSMKQEKYTRASETEILMDYTRIYYYYLNKYKN
jgi:hypothetical protein